MTDEEFRRIYIFLKNKYGIDMSRKKEIVKGRLDNYVSNMGFQSYMDYMNSVESDVTGKLESELVDMLTTNHTFFMREEEHFDYLKNVVLPYWKKKLELKKDICIWCGASSTGEEPYVLAMVVSDFFGLEQKSWDTTILATDVSTAALSTAVAGMYTTEQVSKIPDTWKRRYMKNKMGTDIYEMSEDIKRQVLFRQFNLMSPFPFRKKMHIIFLRNVMIYFNAEDKTNLLKKVYDLLEPGGYLFIGKTETIERDKVPFELIHPSIFRKPERG